MSVTQAESTMDAPRRSKVALQRSSHYLSTPILVPATTSTSRILPSSREGRSGGMRTGWQGTVRDDVDPVSRWVEEAARITRAASYTELPGGSCGSSDRTDSSSERTSSTRDSGLDSERTRSDRNSRFVSTRTGCSVDSTSSLANPPHPLATSLSENEVSVVVSAFSSFRSFTTVSPGLVNLYKAELGEPWSLAFTGVPVLSLTLGGSKARRGRQVSIALAERGTGFALWREVMSHTSCYTASHTTFHTLNSGTDHKVRVGLSWDREELAQAFLSKVDQLTSRPDNLGLSGPRKEKREVRVEQAERRRLDKSQISSPCGFRHTVSVRLEDSSSLFSLQLLLPRREPEYTDSSHL